MYAPSQMQWRVSNHPADAGRDDRRLENRVFRKELLEEQRDALELSTDMRTGVKGVLAPGRRLP